MASATIDFLSGVAGGTACVYVGQPLDTIKVKMQTYPHLYTNAFTCFKQTFANDGIYKGLYAGTVPALAANIAENAVLFMSYGLCQKGIASLRGKSSIKELNTLENASAGGLGAFFASLVLCPTELVKCKLQSVREKSGAAAANAGVGPWKMCKEIYSTRGVRGFYDGLVSTFAREMPGYFLFFGTYEFMRTMLTPAGKKKDDLGPAQTAFCGGIGGLVFWIAIFPADVIKSRVQIDPEGALAKKGFISALRTVAREEGIAKLYSGLKPSIVRTFFATGALFVAVEWTRKGLNKVFGIQEEE